MTKKITIENDSLKIDVTFLKDVLDEKDIKDVIKIFENIKFFKNSIPYTNLDLDSVPKFKNPTINQRIRNYVRDNGPVTTQNIIDAFPDNELIHEKIENMCELGILEKRYGQTYGHGLYAIKENRLSPRPENKTTIQQVRNFVKRNVLVTMQEILNAFPNEKFICKKVASMCRVGILERLYGEMLGQNLYAIKEHDKK